MSWRNAVDLALLYPFQQPNAKIATAIAKSLLNENMPSASCFLGQSAINCTMQTMPSSPPILGRSARLSARKSWPDPEGEFAQAALGGIVNLV